MNETPRRRSTRDQHGNKLFTRRKRRTHPLTTSLPIGKGLGDGYINTVNRLACSAGIARRQRLSRHWSYGPCNWRLIKLWGTVRSDREWIADPLPRLPHCCVQKLLVFRYPYICILFLHNVLWRNKHEIIGLIKGESLTVFDKMKILLSLSIWTR